MAKKTLLVVSSYPEKGLVHGKKAVGVASYTKNTLLALKKTKKDLSIIVLAEQLNKKEESYRENGILVKRIWSKKSLGSLVIIKELIKHRQGPIMVAFEGHMMGNLFSTGLLIFGLIFSKLLGKKIFLVLHQAIEDFREIEKNKIKALILNCLAKTTYRLLIFSSFKTIVFEKHFKEVLGNNKKIVVIPHAIENVKPISQKIARKKLNLSLSKFYLLYFGFLSPYKGIDLLVKKWPKTKAANLIMTGDGNPNHMKKKNYALFVNNLKKEAKSMGIISPGFIPENKIPDYFSAADAVVLPYQIFFSSSGPLSLALSSLKPIIFSNQLRGYFKSNDLKKALQMSGLKEKDFLFHLNPKEIKKKIASLKKDERKYLEFARLIKRERPWNNIAKKYLDELNLK